MVKIIRGSGKRGEQSACRSENNDCAAKNRQLLNKHGVLAVNVMSAPGAGKTSLLETTILAIRENSRCECRVGVIAGDVATDLDCRRYVDRGIEAVQVITGCSGHLSAGLVNDALHHLDLENIDLLFIENVGNLVCPADFDLGHNLNVALLSVTEGHDKPLKYPAMFKAADLVLLSKADFLPHLANFDHDKAEQAIRSVGNEAPVIPISAFKNEFFGLWMSWLLNVHEARKAGEDLRPKIHADGLVMHAED